MRIWISGPRLFGGLIRPGISLGREDFRRPTIDTPPGPIERIALWGMALSLLMFAVVAVGIVGCVVYVLIFGS